MGGWCGAWKHELFSMISAIIKQKACFQPRIQSSPKFRPTPRIWVGHVSGLVTFLGWSRDSPHPSPPRKGLYEYWMLYLLWVTLGYSGLLRVTQAFFFNTFYLCPIWIPIRFPTGLSGLNRSVSD
jgi:hypothetical protein